MSEKNESRGLNNRVILRILREKSFHAIGEDGIFIPSVARKALLMAQVEVPSRENKYQLEVGDVVIYERNAGGSVNWLGTGEGNDYCWMYEADLMAVIHEEGAPGERQA